MIMEFKTYSPGVSSKSSCKGVTRSCIFEIYAEIASAFLKGKAGEPKDTNCSKRNDIVRVYVVYIILSVYLEPELTIDC